MKGHREDTRTPSNASRYVAYLQRTSFRRVLEPIERLAEGLCGGIMVLTWTGSLSVAEAGREDVRTRLIGTLGCNLAWGIIDAIMDLPRTLRRYCAEGRNSREWSHGKPMYNQVITRMPVFSRGAAVHDAMAQADELYFLRQTVTRAAAGTGQVVALIGEAGVGKSRLVYELLHAPQTQGWRLLESAAVSYGQAVPYLPVIDLLRRYTTVEERDDPRGIRTKVTERVLTLDETLQDTIPALLLLLDALPEDHPFLQLEPPSAVSAPSRPSRGCCCAQAGYSHLS